MADKTEKGLRKMFSSLGYWLLFAYFVLAALSVVLFYENGRTTRALIRTGNLEQENRLKIEAGAQAAYTSCISSIPLAIKVNKFAEAELDQHNTLVKNSQSVIDVTPKSDPQYKVKISNLNKLKEDGPNIAAIHFPVQTVKSCKAAEKLALAQTDTPVLPHGKIKS